VMMDRRGASRYQPVRQSGGEQCPATVNLSL
jgi:hypothetical protein